MSLKLPPGRFYGDTSRTFEVAGFGLTETTYPPHCKLPRHSHQRPYFGFILRGAYTEIYGKKTRACQPSMLVYHPADEEHSQHFRQTEGRLFRTEVCPQWLARLDERVPVQNKSVDFRGHVVCQLAARLYYEFRAMDEVSPLVIEGLALEIMGEIFRPTLGVTRPRPPLNSVEARS
jgi:AraC family transcriptional regulator